MEIRMEIWKLNLRRYDNYGLLASACRTLFRRTGEYPKEDVGNSKMWESSQQSRSEGGDTWPSSLCTGVSVEM